MARNRYAGRERRPKVSGSFNSEAGVWLVPVSDAWLNLVSRQWSPPVQLKAETTDGGESYTFKVRQPADGEIVERLVALVTNPSSKLRDGDWNRHELRFAIERVLGISR